MKPQLYLFDVPPIELKQHPFKVGDVVKVNLTGERVVIVRESIVMGTTVTAVRIERLGYLPTRKQIERIMTDKPCKNGTEIFRNLFSIWYHEVEHYTVIPAKVWQSEINKFIRNI